MSHFIVEHRYKGNYVMETITGVEDIDTSRFQDLLGIWVCDSLEELQIMEEELKGLRVQDPVNHPKHYTDHPSGIECIQITEHMGFNLGNALKYIWRCDLKKDAVEDLRKARWYIDRELAKRTSINGSDPECGK
jgi:hypothetical protein